MFDIDDHAVEAQDQLWRDHADRMLRYATFLVGPDDAHDVVVEVIAAGNATSQRSGLVKLTALTRLLRYVLQSRC